MKNLFQFKNLMLYAFLLCFTAIVSCTQESEDPDPIEEKTDTTKVDDDEPKDTTKTDDDDKTKFSFTEIEEAIVLKDATIKKGDLPEITDGVDLKMDKAIIHLAGGAMNRLRIRIPDDHPVDICGVFVKIEGSDNIIDFGAVHMESDSLAILYIGFDPKDLELPIDFKVEIIPYSCLGVPLDKFERDVLIDNGDGCTPNSPIAKWHWVSTVINGALAYAPGFTTNIVTTSTQGCCLDGKSVDCISNGLPESVWLPLEYTSYVEYPQEYIIFLQDGTFNGGLLESTQNLDYSESNFCSGNAAYINRLNDYMFWGEYSFNASDKSVTFTEIETREQEVYLEELDYTVIVYDKCFLGTGYDYEMISCNFLVERSTVEGQLRERLFERWTGGWEWLD